MLCNQLCGQSQSHCYHHVCLKDPAYHFGSHVNNVLFLAEEPSFLTLQMIKSSHTCSGIPLFQLSTIIPPTENLEKLGWQDNKSWGWAALDCCWWVALLGVETTYYWTNFYSIYSSPCCWMCIPLFSPITSYKSSAAILSTFGSNWIRFLSITAEKWIIDFKRTPTYPAST